MFAPSRLNSVGGVRKSTATMEEEGWEHLSSVAPPPKPSTTATTIPPPKQPRLYRLVPKVLQHGLMERVLPTDIVIKALLDVQPRQSHHPPLARQASLLCWQRHLHSCGGAHNLTGEEAAGACWGGDKSLTSTTMYH